MKNDDISVLNLTVRSYNALKRMGINTVAELETRTADVMKMLPKTYPRILKAVEEYRGKPIVSSENESARTYKEIFLEHFPNFDVSKFENFAENFCIDSFFDDGGQFCPYGGEDGYGKCKKHWETKCLFEWCEGPGSNNIEKYLIPKTDEIPAQELIPAPAEETPAVFDYSELDSDTADKLRVISEKVISIKARYILETAQQVKIAHDLLANNRDGMFGAWCVSVGFTRQTGNNYLNIVKLFDNITDEQRENLTKLTEGNMNLLYAITKPSAPPELVEAVKSGDITTHKEYIALKAELDRTREECRQIDANSAAKDKEYERDIQAVKSELRKTQNKNTELEAQVKELKKRDIQVVFEKDETEINRLQEENTQLEKQLREAQDELMFAAPPADDIKIFAVKLTLEEYETLTDIADKYGSAIIGQAVKNAQIIRI